MKVLIYGGRGGLGSALVSHFKKEGGCHVISVDLFANDTADENVTVDPKDDVVVQEQKILESVGKLLGAEKLDAILNMAGGWAGGSSGSEDMVKNADLMWKQSVWSSAITARLAHKFLATGGLVVLPGAEPAQSADGTPGMIGYGMAKAAVHQLTRSLAADPTLPEGTRVYSTLPITLDTPMNRKFMPDADHSAWTPLSFVAELMHKWTSDPTSRPAKNGALVVLKTTNGKTELKLL